LSRAREEKLPEEEKNQQQVSREGKSAVEREENIQQQASSEAMKKSDKFRSKEVGKNSEEPTAAPGLCKKCGKVGHKTKECYRPLVCSRCKKEGHVPRACSEYLSWECIAPFCILAALELGFHIIQDEDTGDTVKDNSNYALITIK
jgi:hypothetical protein